MNINTTYDAKRQLDPSTIHKLHDVLNGRSAGAIFCADSLDLMSSMPPLSADLILTSPPYYNLKDYDCQLPFTTIESYLDWLTQIIQAFYSTLTPDGFVIFIIGLYVQFHHTIHLPARALALFEQQGFFLANELIWHKPKGCQGLWTMPMTRWLKGIISQPIFANQHEYIQIYHKGNPKQLSRHPEQFIKRVAWSVQTHRVSTTKGHPAPFPHPLVNDLIHCFSLEQDLVLDPFIGTGATAFCAHHLNRRFLGCDLNPHYVARALSLIESDPNSSLVPQAQPNNEQVPHQSNL